MVIHLKCRKLLDLIWGAGERDVAELAHQSVSQTVSAVPRHKALLVSEERHWSYEPKDEQFQAYVFHKIGVAVLVPFITPVITRDLALRFPRRADHCLSLLEKEREV